MFKTISIFDSFVEKIGNVAYLVIGRMVYFLVTDHQPGNDTYRENAIKSIMEDQDIRNPNSHLFFEIVTHLTDISIKPGDFAVKLYLQVQTADHLALYVYTITSSVRCGALTYSADELWSLPPKVKREFAKLIGGAKLEIANEGYPGRVF